MDLDRIYLLLCVAEKAALHGPKYQWAANAALEELNKIQAEHDKEPAPVEEEV